MDEVVEVSTCCVVDLNVYELEVSDMPLSEVANMTCNSLVLKILTNQLGEKI